MIHRRTALPLALLMATLLMAGCVSIEKIAPPVDQLQVSGAANGSLYEGRNIYITRCAKCHSVEPIKRYTRERWEVKILPKMTKATKLTPEEATSVRNYILAVLRT